jgi:hypothetical protein
MQRVVAATHARRRGGANLVASELARGRQASLLGSIDQPEALLDKRCGGDNRQRLVDLDERALGEAVGQLPDPVDAPDQEVQLVAEADSLGFRHGPEPPWAAS